MGRAHNFIEAYVVDLGREVEIRKTVGRRGSYTKSSFIERDRPRVYYGYEWDMDREKAIIKARKYIVSEIQRLQNCLIEIGVV